MRTRARGKVREGAWCVSKVTKRNAYPPAHAAKPHAAREHCHGIPALYTWVMPRLGQNPDLHLELGELGLVRRRSGSRGSRGSRSFLHSLHLSGPSQKTDCTRQTEKSRTFSFFSFFASPPSCMTPRMSAPRPAKRGRTGTGAACSSKSKRENFNLISSILLPVTLDILRRLFLLLLVFLALCCDNEQMIHNGWKAAALHRTPGTHTQSPCPCLSRHPWLRGPRPASFPGCSVHQ